MNVLYKFSDGKVYEVSDVEKIQGKGSMLSLLIKKEKSNFVVTFRKSGKIKFGPQNGYEKQESPDYFQKITPTKKGLF